MRHLNAVTILIAASAARVEAQIEANQAELTIPQRLGAVPLKNGAEDSANPGLDAISAP
ncbi:hypothetical protein QA641_11065 [Bradyrhizobium sp. CB1650]|uniref:hypothetical protein n=1 Tax=Bradyrhizobium sp. CB1650 TaxID=3039153 RepID=UPI0024354EDB|nr:hypothetical protein [Bradyrhizobium sp. CB1650]WGD54392.1 hypothetical protein QA641_11065 [Bradyrhizobium sp. CB1650]